MKNTKYVRNETNNIKLKVLKEIIELKKDINRSLINIQRVYYLDREEIYKAVSEYIKLATIQNEKDNIKERIELIENMQANINLINIYIVYLFDEHQISDRMYLKLGDRISKIVAYGTALKKHFKTEYNKMRKNMLNEAKNV